MMTNLKHWFSMYLNITFKNCIMDEILLSLIIYLKTKQQQTNKETNKETNKQTRNNETKK